MSRGGFTSSAIMTIPVAGGGGAIALGSHIKKFGTGAGNVTTDPIITQASGITMLCVVAFDPTNDVTVNPDSKGNIYTPYAAKLGVSSTNRVYYSQNAVGGSGHTIGVSNSANIERTIFLIEVRNTLAASWDAAAANQGIDGAPGTLAMSGNMAQAANFAFATCSGNSSSNPATFTESNAFDMVEEELDGSANWTLWFGYQITAAVTGLTAAFDQSGSSGLVMNIGAIKQN